MRSVTTALLLLSLITKSLCRVSSLVGMRVQRGPTSRLVISHSGYRTSLSSPTVCRNSSSCTVSTMQLLQAPTKIFRTRRKLLATQRLSSRTWISPLSIRELVKVSITRAPQSLTTSSGHLTMDATTPTTSATLVSKPPTFVESRIRRASTVRTTSPSSRENHAPASTTISSVTMATPLMLTALALAPRLLMSNNCSRQHRLVKLRCAMSLAIMRSVRATARSQATSARAVSNSNQRSTTATVVSSVKCSAGPECS